MVSAQTTICFMGVFSKTYVFKEIARRLEANGLAICWIVNKLEQYNLLKEIYGADKVLYINREFIHRTTNALGDFKINELIYGDRVFKHEMKAGVKYFTNIQRPMYDFILRNKVRFAIGEVTSGHEVLLVRMCKQFPDLNCDYIQCIDIRIPTMRVGLFLGEGDFSMVQFENPNDKPDPIQIEKPKYLALNNRILKKNLSTTGKLRRIIRFITGENIEKNDPIVTVNKWKRFKLASSEELNRVTYSFLTKNKLKDVEREKYIFFGFHKQPENTIDVQGRYNDDQFTVVTTLWRLLPPGWKLLVKEHPSAVGDRSYTFYKGLLKFPGVILMEESIDSKLLIAGSQLVVTVCGTMSYEAALMQKPAITLSKTFFNDINYCRFVPFAQLVKYDSLLTLIDEIRSQPDNRLQFSRYLYKNTFDAYISDQVTDPSVMSEENVGKLAMVFMKLVEKYGKSPLVVHEPGQSMSV